MDDSILYNHLINVSECGCLCRLHTTLLRLGILLRPTGLSPSPDLFSYRDAPTGPALYRILHQTLGKESAGGGRVEGNCMRAAQHNCEVLRPHGHSSECDYSLLADVMAHLSMNKFLSKYRVLDVCYKKTIIIYLIFIFVFILYFINTRKIN